MLKSMATEMGNSAGLDGGNIAEEQDRRLTMKVRAVWWDPQNPALLNMFPVFAGESSDNNSRQFYPLYSELGTGCNKHEVTALLKLIQAHQEYFSEDQSSDDHPHGGGTDPSTQWKDLLKNYRAFLKECILAWQEDLKREEGEETTTTEGGTPSSDQLQEDRLSLELLRKTYAFMHLSDIYLPLLTHDWERDDPYQIQGFVTADTVRFVRQHHASDPQDMDGNLAEMLDSQYPEQYGEDGSLYWDFLRALVLRGRLDQAFLVLCAHSKYEMMREAMERGDELDPEYLAAAYELQEGFQQIQNIFLRAPLPGGRTHEFDDALGDVYDDGSVEKWQDGNYDDDNDMGVSSSDYKLWDSNGTGDYPSQYSPDAAIRKHRQWQEYVHHVRDKCVLLRKIPELDSLLAIICGDFDSGYFESWAEHFLADLLYGGICGLRPRDMPNRATYYINKYGNLNDETNSILRIMEGNASKAIDVINRLGGHSGAALPATLMALLFSVFVESGIVGHELAGWKSEFLCDSAFAIRSSLADTDNDIGAQLAIRLLLPYATKERDLQLALTIAEILDHYSPSTTQYGTMVDYCNPLIKMKSLPVLQGCTRMLLYVYQKYLGEGKAGDAAAVLLQGIELEASFFPSAVKGACYSSLARECHRLSLHLLQITSGDVAMNTPAVAAAHVMAEAFDKSDGIDKIPEATQLLRVVKIYDATHDDSEKDLPDALKLITACLDRIQHSASNAVTMTAPSPLHGLLLKVSQRLLQRLDEKDTPMNLDLHEISLLLKEPSVLLGHGNADMQKSFLMEGLKNAFVDQNARLREFRPDSKRNNDMAGLYTADLHKYDAATQERLVQFLLDD